MKAKEPGELVQVDHMTLTKHNITSKVLKEGNTRDVI
jgi:hypothetical protein